MATRLSGLVDWERFKKMSESEQEKERLKNGATDRGKSKSGLDWDQEEDPSAPQNWEEMAESEDASDKEVIQEWGLDEEDDEPGEEERSLKALVKSIHKHAAELYNILDEMDDPEEWVVDKAREAAAAVAEIHSHVDYNKEKAEELASEPGGFEGRGW